MRIPGFNSLSVRWTDPGGGSWELETDTLSEADLLKAADGLQLSTAPNVAPASAGWLPPGFEVTYQRVQPVPVSPAETHWWHAGIGNGMTFSLAIHENTPDDPLIGRVTSAHGQRLLQVRGHPALTSTSDGNTALLWDERPDIRVELSGEFDLDTIIRIAESLEPVPANDPRIK